MRKIFLATALLVASSPAVASDMVRISKDGYKVEYSVTPQADGSTLIAGTELTSNEPFKLHVVGHTVAGEVAGRSVAFNVTRKQAAALRH